MSIEKRNVSDDTHPNPQDKGLPRSLNLAEQLTLNQSRTLTKNAETPVFFRLKCTSDNFSISVVFGCFCAFRGSLTPGVRYDGSMKIQKGDLLTTKTTTVQKPVVRVERVSRDGVVHCVNLIACSTMKAGVEFCFDADAETRYTLRSKARSRRRSS